MAVLLVIYPYNIVAFMLLLHGSTPGHLEPFYIISVGAGMNFLAKTFLHLALSYVRYFQIYNFLLSATMNLTYS